MNSENKYEDIISLPHHISEARKHMSPYDRAAQFSPFAALTGHDEALKETARLTDRKPDIDENEKLIISEKLQMIMNKTLPETKVSIIHFVHDEKKSGGAYLKTEGFIRKYDSFARKIIMSDKETIDIDAVVSVDVV